MCTACNIDNSVDPICSAYAATGVRKLCMRAGWYHIRKTIFGAAVDYWVLSGAFLSHLESGAFSNHLESVSLKFDVCKKHSSRSD